MKGIKLNYTVAGITLNYLTLSISDSDATNDLKEHRLTQLNGLFWLAQPFSVFNLLIQLFNVFVSKSQTPAKLLSSGISFFFLTILWSILRARFFKATRWVFPAWWVIVAINFLAQGMTHDEESFLFNLQEHQSTFISTTVNFIIVASFFGYCEFRLACFLYFPLYITTCMMIVVYQEPIVTEARS